TDSSSPEASRNSSAPMTETPRVSSAWSRWRAPCEPPPDPAPDAPRPRAASGATRAASSAPPPTPTASPTTRASASPVQPPSANRYAAYAPPRYSVPCARFSTSIIPNTNDSPTASVKYSNPNAAPSTMDTACASNQPITGGKGSSAERDQFRDHAVGQHRAIHTDLAQVPLLQRRAVLVELPRAARAVDGAHLADRGVERLRGEAAGLARDRDRLVQYRRGVERGHRVRGGDQVVHLLVLGREPAVGRVVQVGRVVHGREDALGR